MGVFRIAFLLFILLGLPTILHTTRRRLVREFLHFKVCQFFTTRVICGYMQLITLFVSLIRQMSGQNSN